MSRTKQQQNQRISTVQLGLSESHVNHEWIGTDADIPEKIKINQQKESIELTEDAGSGERLSGDETTKYPGD